MIQRFNKTCAYLKVFIKRIYYKGTFLLRRLVLVGLLLLEHVALLPAEGIGPAHQLPVDPLVEVAA